MEEPVNWERTIKELLTKLTETLVQNRCGKINIPHSLTSSNSFLQTEILETQAIRTLASRELWEWNLDTPKHFFLEFTQTVEACHPILIERWTFSYFPKNNSEPRNYYIEASSFLRSLMVLGMQLPGTSKFNQELRYSIKTSHTHLTDWSKHASSPEVKSSPLLQLNTALGNLTAKCEYIERVPRPEIKPQELGMRPRLISSDNENFKHESFDSERRDTPSLNSTEGSLPLHCLPILEQNQEQESSEALLLITSKCVHEHQDLGFTPLSHTLCEDSPYETEDDFSDEMPVYRYTNPFAPEDELSEDSRVAVYKRECDRVSRVELFSSCADASALTSVLADLQSSFRKLKQVKDELCLT